MSDNKTHTVSFEEVSQETDRAYLIDFGGGDKHWLPKSQVTLVENKKEVDIPDWLYENKFQ